MGLRIKGFTLIEILIVVAISGIIGTAVVTRTVNNQQRARNATRRAVAMQLVTAVVGFEAVDKYFPSSLTQLVPQNISSLPLDPSNLSACNNGSTSDGKLGYLTYFDGGVNANQEGFMVLSQLEAGGIGIDYNQIYLLTGTTPCNNSTLPVRYRIANSVCTSKPGRVTNNPPRVAYHPSDNKIPKRVSDFISIKTYAQESPPTCNGKIATIWVNSSNKVVGGTNSGQNYNYSNLTTTYNLTTTDYRPNQVIVGTSGDDTISSLGGNDTICGLGGNDIINSGNGNDWVDGGDGNDTIDGSNGNDMIYGGAGDDILNGAQDMDEIHGGDGNDIINGQSQSDILYGDAGNDTIYGEDGDETIYGGDGIDMIYGGAGNDTIYGEDGDDMIRGADGDDIIYGGDGNDMLYADPGNDIVYGGVGDDLIKGDSGDDKLSGGDGNDDIYGESSNDIKYGGADNDDLYGSDGEDWISGGQGGDFFKGGYGSNYCSDFNTSEGDTLQNEDARNLSCGATAGSNGGRNGFDATSCTSSSFDPLCNSDYDGDGMSNIAEGTTGNSDGDAYPDWRESSIIGGLDTDRVGNGDPDGDTVPNQSDPNNICACIPNVTPDCALFSSCPSSGGGGEVQPIGGNPPIVGIDCASYISLPHGSKAYYVHIQNR